jgi:hypothetical protein
VTWEAKHQLQQILTSVGIPEETLLPIMMETIGPDPKLDVQSNVPLISKKLLKFLNNKKISNTK